MISLIFLFLGAAMILAGVYFLRQEEKKPDTYVWVGSGNDPFKD